YLTSNTGGALAYQPITFSITGANWTPVTVITDSFGVAKLDNASIAGISVADHSDYITASFNGTALYSAMTKTAMLSVTQQSSLITWHNPADIFYGTMLSDTQLNATASVPGSFA